MKKKLLIVFFILIAAVCCAFAFAACGGHVHDWGDWQLTTPATCSAQGEETRTCKLDSTHKETRNTAIDPTAHRIHHVAAQAATCSAKGWNAYDECELCGFGEDNKVEIDIDPAAHKFKHVEAQAATCSAKGWDAYDVCKLCGYNTKVETDIDPDAHTYGVDNLCVGCRHAWNYTQNLSYQLNGDNLSYSVIGIGSATDIDIVIPYGYNDKPVTTIGNSAFFGCTSLASITIPDSITSISSRAFWECKSLESVTIGAGVTTIGWGAFDGCESLESMDIPAGVTSIGDYAFYNCTSLESVTIPIGVTSIGDYAFYNCTSLESVTFENQTGWKVSRYSNMSNARDINVNNAATNASNLTNTYHDYYWHRYDEE